MTNLLLKKNKKKKTNLILNYLLLFFGLCFVVAFIIFAYILSKLNIDETNFEIIKIEKIIDADTIEGTINGQKEKIRFYGIDAPEKKQEYGTNATDFLKTQLTLNNKYKIEIQDIDRYNRKVAIITNKEGTSIQSILLSAGYAWVYDEYCKISICNHWKDLQETAKKEKIGLWQSNNPIEPKNYRRQ